MDCQFITGHISGKRFKYCPSAAHERDRDNKERHYCSHHARAVEALKTNHKLKEVMLTYGTIFDPRSNAREA